MTDVNPATPLPVVLTSQEFRAIQLMVERLAWREGEDVIGCILKTSGARVLNDHQASALARKLEQPIDG